MPNSILIIVKLYIGLSPDDRMELLDELQRLESMRKPTKEAYEEAIKNMAIV